MNVRGFLWVRLYVDLRRQASAACQ
ncbi:MAG: putative leader peptide [Actinopolymorphaceae bacterium]